MNMEYNIETREVDTLLQARIEDLRRRIHSHPPVPTGIQELDALTGGLRHHRFYAAFAHPPFCPSDVSLQVAYGAALAGKRVLFVSCENRPCLLAQRLLFSLAGLSYRALIQNDTAEMMARLPMVESAAEQVKRLKITLMQVGEAGAEEVLGKIARQCFVCSPDLVVVDAFQLFECMYGKHREAAFSAEGKMWRNFAHAIDAPVFAVDSSIRFCENPGSHPELDKIRGFRALEEHADMLMLLYRTAATQTAGGRACLQVFKNADGENQSVTILAPERYPLFYEQGWRGDK